MEKNNTYRLVSYIILGLVTIYFAVGYFLIKYNYTGSSISSLFTGTPYLELRDEKLKITIKVDYNSLELQFGEYLDDEPKIINPESIASKIIVKGPPPSNDWITLKTPNGESLQNETLKLLLINTQKEGYFRKLEIKSAKLNGQEHSVSEFYHKYISSKESNLELIYPLSHINISSLLAKYLGDRLMAVIVVTLLILLSCQILLFIIFILWQPKTIKEFFKDSSNKQITLVDDISNSFSIPLGFLGTVVSVWVSLERSEIDYRSFIQILEIVKIAVFTTVLGLSIKIICIVRGRLTGIMKDN